MSESKKTSDSRLRANAKYNKAHTKLLQIRLNFRTDKDIFDKLETVESKSGYIKDLIRRDIIDSK